MELSDLLKLALKKQASDLHLSSGLPPALRINGQIEQINPTPLLSEQIKSMVYSIMSKALQQKFKQNLTVDFAFTLPNLIRIRSNIFMQLHGISAVFRIIPHQIPSLVQLNCPPILKKITTYTKGLILVTGSSGAGKSTTLAALIDYINSNTAQHILTIEDPIEFIHHSKQSIINQRELTTHTLSFAQALNAALREDPDIILIGELRDLSTIRMALTAAETGHLVFATLHTASAATTINRIIDVFPAAEKEMVRVMLSESLRAVIAQILLPRINNSGRVAFYEVMLVNTALKNMIRENKLAQINSVIQTNQQQGMQLLDQALLLGVQHSIISPTTARPHLLYPDLLP